MYFGDFVVFVTCISIEFISSPNKYFLFSKLCALYACCSLQVPVLTPIGDNFYCIMPLIH